MAKILFIKPNTAIHIGADRGQSREQYLKLGCTNIIWCEADPANVKTLRTNFPNDRVIPGVAWNSSSKDFKFYITKNRAHNSAIKPVKNIGLEYLRTIKIKSYSIDDVVKVSDLIGKTLVVIDVQGAEEFVLKGAVKILSRVEYLIIEIAKTSQGYEYTPLESSINNIVKQKGFKPTIFRLSHDGSYKDQLYIKCSNSRIIIIKSLDYIFGFFMKIRHALTKNHWPDYYYSCKECKINN